VNVIIGGKNLRVHCSLLFIYCSRWESCNDTARVRALFMSLCMSGILQRYYSCHCAHQNTVHLTVRIRNPTETMFMSLSASEHYLRHCACQDTAHIIVHVTVLVKTLFMYCSFYCRSIFNRKNRQCTTHGTVHVISTAKTVGALFMNMWMQTRLLKLSV